jgi:Holliday junction resolvase
MYSLDQLRKKSPREFERFVAKVLPRMGYKKIKVTSFTSDSGYDIVAYKNNQKVLFECKRYSKFNKVSSREIRIFADACRRKKANKGIFITTSEFTQNVWKEQNERSLSLKFWDGKILLRKIKNSQKEKAYCVNCKKKLKGFYTEYRWWNESSTRLKKKDNSSQLITIKEALSESINSLVPANPKLCEDCKYITKCMWCNKKVDIRENDAFFFQWGYIHYKCREIWKREQLKTKFKKRNRTKKEKWKSELPEKGISCSKSRSEPSKGLKRFITGLVSILVLSFIISLFQGIKYFFNIFILLSIMVFCGYMFIFWD